MSSLICKCPKINLGILGRHSLFVAQSPFLTQEIKIVAKTIASSEYAPVIRVGIERNPSLWLGSTALEEITQNDQIFCLRNSMNLEINKVINFNDHVFLEVEVPAQNVFEVSFYLFGILI